MVYFIIVMSVLTFTLWGYDKYQAIRHRWRVPERWLYALVITGGSFGALAGMTFFRHKIRKYLFWFVVMISLVIHTIFLTRLSEVVN